MVVTNTEYKKIIAKKIKTRNFNEYITRVVLLMIRNIVNRIYFEALLVAMKMEKRIRLYIFSFCCLNFLFFSLRRSEIYLGWVSCFNFCKITVYITRNAPLIRKIFNNKTDIYFFLICKLLFFS